MKVLSTFTATVAVLVSVVTSNADIERKLIIGGSTVPTGTKTYTAGLRRTIDGYNFCGGCLISPSHVLTASHCVSNDIRWVSIGSHFQNGTQDGEQIRVKSIMSHPNLSENVLWSNNFVVLGLEKPSSFKLVGLAEADDSDYQAGKWAYTMGWGTNAQVNGTTEYELQGVEVQLAADEDCAKYETVDSSMVCAGGVLNKDSCSGDSGGPLIVSDANSTEDVLVGLVGWAKNDTCAREGYYGIYSRVSSAHLWIDATTGGGNSSWIN